jgi:5-oxoprolinase (ATP-hydrolysing)
MLNMRFDGTDTALMVLPGEGKDEIDEDGAPDYLKAFQRAYKEEFGFLLDTKRVMVDDIKVYRYHYERCFT